MRVLIAGATGVLGRRLVDILVRRGHEVRGLARSPAGEETVRKAGGVPVRADLFDADALTRAAEGCESLVHAATAIPEKARVKVSDFALNDRIRREGTRALIAAAQAVRARRLVFQSIVWAVRPESGAPFDESSPPGDDPVGLSALDGEKMVSDAGFTTLRCGWFYGADAGSTRSLAQALLKRRVALVSGGKARLSYLHLDDAASAFSTAAESGRPGTWHVVDDEPVSSADWFRALAERIGAPMPFSVPALVARLAAGDVAVRLLRSPMITNALKFKRDFGWAPAYPTFREGLDQVVAAWRVSGFFPHQSSA